MADFARAVASRRPVPGSGSVAAAAGALGAGLASMALRAPAGEGAAESAAIAEHMEALLGCVDDDARAFAELLEARRRGEGLVAALERSIEVPRALAARALSALELFVPALATVRPALASEADLSLHLLAAAVRGGVVTARANLGLLADSGRRTALAGELDGLLRRAGELVARAGTGGAR